MRKINNLGWKQERIIIVTNEKIYNIKKYKAKRKIKVTLLGGISKTVIGARNEFTLHVPSSYDYRFQTDR